MNLNNFQNKDIENQQEREEKIKEAKEFEKSPWIFLVKRNRLTYLIIAFLFIFGVFTIGQLPRELNPEVEIPYAIITTGYPGASPTNIEDQITEKIENGISNLEGIDQINSTSSLGFSSIVVQFEADRDLDESIRNLKDKVDDINQNLPEDASDPKVVEINISDEAIFVATLSSDSHDISDMKKYAEDLQDKLEGIPYVLEAKVVGGKDRTVNIEVDQNFIAQKGISIGEIISAISVNNLDFPLGSIDLANSRYSLRVSGEFKTAQEISNLPVKYSGEVPIYLGDIAKVEDGFSDNDSISRLSINHNAPKESISIEVYKKTGGDITDVAEEAEKIVKNGKGIDYPEDVEAIITTNNASYIEESINTLMNNGMQTVLIILILLFMFLGWREALVAGLSVPFSFFVAFIIMSIVGESLNFLSLFALILALGLLVDSAIVIVEGIYKLVGKYKISGYQGAILAIKDYAAPLLSGMLTTIAVFFPLMFVKGIIGEFIKTIPIVVNATLAAALFVSLTIVPAIGSLVFKPQKKREENDSDNLARMGIWKKIRKVCHPKPREERLATKVFDKISSRYFEFLPKLIGQKKNRVKVIWLTIILFAFSLSLPISGILNVESFGKTDSDNFSIRVELPEGTLISKTDEITQKVEAIVLGEKEVTNFVTSIGSSSGSSVSSGNNQENRAYVRVNITDKEDRKEKSYDITARIRKQINKEITEADVTINEESSGPPGGSPIELRVVGDDLVTLNELAEEIKDELSQIDTVINADTSVKFSSGEFVFAPDKEIISKTGLSVYQIASQLRSGISGNNDSTISRDGEDLDIVIKYDKNRLESVSDFEGIVINSASGSYSLSELGEVTLEPSLTEINRRDKERIVSITADTQGGNASEITKELQSRIEKIDMPNGYRVDYGGEQEEIEDTFTDMFLKMIIGILLILFILTIQFNSYKQVFIIFLTIPLAMIGVFVGMTISRLTIDIPAFIGIISLAGIVVNNAIVLIDQINKELTKGSELIEAVRVSGKLRLRPIILTSITTVFGLLPLSITQPDWRNMGFTIIFGLTFATFSTLLVVPTIFVSLYRKKIKT